MHKSMKCDTGTNDPELQIRGNSELSKRWYPIQLGFINTIIKQEKAVTW